MTLTCTSNPFKIVLVLVSWITVKSLRCDLYRCSFSWYTRNHGLFLCVCDFAPEITFSNARRKIFHLTDLGTCSGFIILNGNALRFEDDSPKLFRVPEVACDIWGTWIWMKDCYSNRRLSTTASSSPLRFDRIRNKAESDGGCTNEPRHWNTVWLPIPW